MIHKFTTFGKVLAPLCLAVLLLATACGGNPAVDRLLDTADSLSNVKPDSALRLLDSALPPDSSKNLQSSIFNLPSSQHMRLELLRARCMNKAYISFTTDSVLLDVVKYYDRHGTPNQQMEAHYLLGCAYRDMGEAPHALDCYLDAIAKADTTTENFDYRALGSIYVQTAFLYQQMMLFSYELEAHRKAAYYDYLAGDTLYAIYEQKMVAGAYIMQNKPDSAEALLNDAILLYRTNGFEREAILSSTMLMHLYLGKPERQKDLKHLIDEYDRYYGLVRDSNELPPSERLYFYYKGRYYEDVGKLDSAEYYYRKIYRPNMPYTSQTPMYSGLLSVFRNKEVADSIAKYAQLYCTANDSSVLLKDREITAQQSASYQYSRYQKEAQENEERARKTERMLIVLALSVLCVLAVGIYYARQYKKRQLERRRKLEEDYKNRESLQRKKHIQELSRQEALYQQKDEELRRLSDIYHKVTETIRQELEHDKTVLEDEIQKLTLNISELKKQEAFGSNDEKSILLHNSDIVKNLKSKTDDPLQQMTEDETLSLEIAFGRLFPLFLQDVKQARGVNRSDELVAMLSALGFRPAQIQTLTDKSPSQITNSKAKINKALFADRSASSLYGNLVSRYGICC